ncbi:MAG: hypothetical protein M1820_008092 [Bogoriella megaspora]|nr:MAG: hypothetical protein M1820_008092 [Bogoriella megaspora]
MPVATHTNGVNDDLRLDVNLQSIKRVDTPQNDSHDSSRNGSLRVSLTDESEDEAPNPRLPSDPSSQPSPKKRVKSFGHLTKTKAKKALHVGSTTHQKSPADRIDTDDEDEHYNLDENAVLKAVKSNPAFSPKALMRNEKSSISGAIDSAFGNTKGTLQAIAHPRRAIKAKAAKKLATPDHPYLSPEADVQLLDTHEQMVRIQTSRTASSVETSSELESEAERLEEKVQSLEADREKARVAYITSRHIFRVRVVPKQYFEFPAKDDYYELNNDGTRGRFRYERYIGALMLYYSQDFTSQYIDDFNALPLNRDTLLRHVERLVMVSAPWQEWLVNVRRVYRWEDPARTWKWLAIILVVWYYNHMITFLYSYVIYITIRQRIDPESIQEIRDSYERALSRGAQAFRFSEVINKHGNDKWLDPLLDQIGPLVQLQVADLADLLEIYQNFYEWKDPWMTTCTLIFILIMVILGHFTTLDFSFKILMWIGIVYFFFSRPISSLYPRYRHVVSPLKWIIWDIPTHAEWAFRYLRREAQNTRATLISQRVTEKYLNEEIDPAGPAYVGSMELPTTARTTSTDGTAVENDDYDSDDSTTSYYTASSSTSVLGSKPLLSFRCKWGIHIGRLTLTGANLYFASSLPPHRKHWSRSYLELVEMRKFSSESRVGRFATMEVLQFCWTDGSTDEVVETRGCRDEMFNCVLGFSGLKWQALQPLGNNVKSEEEAERGKKG